MVKTLDRYIFKELSKMFLLCFLLLMSTLILEKINFIARLVLDKGVSVAEVFGLIVYISPAFMTFTLPLAILLASLITFSQLSGDNEITAMRAGGVSLYRMLAPVGVLSLLVTLFSFYLTLNVMHVGNFKFMDNLTKLASRTVQAQLDERVFFDGLPNIVIYVNEKETGSNILKGIFIYDGQSEKNPRMITAGYGELSPGGENIILKLREGSVYSGDEESFRLIRYDEYDLLFDIGKGGKAGFNRWPRDMSITEIKNQMKDKEANNLPVFHERVEIQKRFALPVSCLILGFLGAVLGVRISLGGRWGGVGLGILMAVFNYLMFMMGEGLGREGTVDPVISMWAPNALLGSITLFLIYSASRETAPFNAVVWLESALLSLTRRFRGSKAVK